MSTIKSSSEDLTLNADGLGKDIKFQSNGVEKASISSAGALTAISTINAGSVGSSGGVRGKINFGGVSGVADGFTITNQNGNYLDIKPNSTNSGIKILNSGGLCFGTDTATANALDDYEEGDWTPIISGSSPPGVGTYQDTWGKYTKVGNVVTINFNLRSKTHTGSGGSYLGGLPFTSKNCSGNWDIPIGGELLSCGSGKVLKGHLHKNAVIARVMKIDYNGGESYMINIENNDMILSGSFSYLAE